MKGWQQSVLEPIRRFYALPWPDKRLLIGSLWLVALVRSSLWIFPFARSHDLWTHNITPLLPIPHIEIRNSSPPCVQSPNVEKQAAWAIEHAAALIPDATCLVRAYALQALLQKNGIESTLKIGVRRAASGQIEAHAWLEKDGQLLIGDLPDLTAFSPLPPLEPISHHFDNQ